jgi:hypothetical protein
MSKKLVYIFIQICFSLILISIGSAQEIPDGPYFGQKPPGTIAEVFAPGIISLENRFEQNAAFTPDGKEFYFSTTTCNWDSFQIYYTKQKDGVWTEMQNAGSVLGYYANLEPFITDNGKQFFFVSIRPSVPPWITDIWVCERNDTVWSAPQKIPVPISTASREWHPSVS